LNFPLISPNLLMGIQSSRLEKQLGTSFPENEHYFGYENYGNTCYCNSVLQALYFCIPFRMKIIEYFKNDLPEDNQDTLLGSLSEFFYSIHSNRKRTGITGPKKFIALLKKENEIFRGYMQQDAHEFLNFLLNEIAEYLERKDKNREQLNGKFLPKISNSGSVDSGASLYEPYLFSQRNPNEKSNHRPIYNDLSKEEARVTQLNSSIISGLPETAIKKSPQDKPMGSHECSPSGKQGGNTFVHQIFEGLLRNETKCLVCETITSKSECFLDLSVDIEQNTSLTHCLQNFSSTEVLSGQNKFYCDFCHSKQEAQKRIKIQRLPPILVLHLKRFKYVEELSRYKKLTHRVSFPMELRLENITMDSRDVTLLYSLFAVVIHIGSGPNVGHYVSIVKSAGHWLLFDDEEIQLIEDQDIACCFGATNETLRFNPRRTDCGYILFYQIISPPKTKRVDHEGVSSQSSIAQDDCQVNRTQSSPNSTLQPNQELPQQENKAPFSSEITATRASSTDKAMSSSSLMSPRRSVQNTSNESSHSDFVSSPNNPHSNTAGTELYCM